MDENEYRATYHDVNKRRCVFEKALNSRVCSCEKSDRFNLADREGVACKTQSAQSLCKELIQHLRSNSRFALRLTQINGPLPHASEIRIQNGGLLGLQKALSNGQQDHSTVKDIHGLIQLTVARYGGWNSIPYHKIVQSIIRYQLRHRRSRK